MENQKINNGRANARNFFVAAVLVKKNWKPATDQNEIRFKAADFLLEEQTSGNLFLNSLKYM